ncbi:MAG: transposon-encoded TnpW family protein [Eubacteriales bacterium]
MREQSVKQVSTSPTEGTFTHKIGKTTYTVGVHFSKTSKETLQDKIERLIINDLEKEKYL